MEQQSNYRLKYSIIHYDNTGSTNEDAKRLALEGAKEGTVVVAESQSAGKGRRGRQWISPAGSNLYFTLLLKPEFEPDKVSMLTLVMALSVLEAMEKELGDELPFRIKWPNDIVVNGRKVCGILTEMIMENCLVQSVVIGVGININQTDFPKELEDAATSLFIEKQKVKLEPKTDIKEKLLKDILDSFESNYGLFLQDLSLNFLKESYEAYLVNLNREVKVLDPAGEFEGRAMGINEKGELLVRTADGSIKEIYAGEVSVRGIYGYI